MNADLLQAICKDVYRRFPEFAGVRPKVQASANGGSQRAAYTITFQIRVKVDGNHNLSRWVRVVADETGHVIKLTTSR